MKSSILRILQVCAFLLPSFSLPALVVTIGDEKEGTLESVYIDCAAVTESSTGRLYCNAQDLVHSLAAKICQNSSYRIFVGYRATDFGCETADRVRTCLLNCGISLEQIITLEMPASDPESKEGFVEIALLPGNSQLTYAMAK